ncbi:MAG: Fur family transcriptional regulator [Actinomycetota bacterium]
MSPVRRPAAVRRPTRQRTAIVEALAKAPGFRSAQELHADLMRQGGRIGLATVYRNLQALADAGEVDALRTDAGEMAYRLCGEDHHHHLVCRDCGATVELVADQVEEWAALVGRRHGFSDVTHTVEIFGLCGSCSA